MDISSFFPRNKKRQKKPLPFPPRAHFFRIGKAGKGGGEYIQGTCGASISFFWEAMLLPLLVCHECATKSTDLRRAKPRFCPPHHCSSFFPQKETDGKKNKPWFVSPLCCCRIRLCAWCWWVWIREGMTKETHNSFSPFFLRHSRTLNPSFLVTETENSSVSSSSLAVTVEMVKYQKILFFGPFFKKQAIF